MTVFEFDPEADVQIVLRTVGFLPRVGATRQHLETLNGVSYADGSRFGNALAAAVERGLVRQVGKRYHLTEGASQ